jgi:hypothetical protein
VIGLAQDLFLESATMKTFGEFFDQVDGRLQRTGLTDTPCHWMASFSEKHRSNHHHHRGNPGWNSYRNLPLANENFCEFVAYMVALSGGHLLAQASAMNGRSDHLTWDANMVFLLYQTIVDEANQCGFKVDGVFGFEKMGDEIRTIGKFSR